LPISRVLAQGIVEIESINKEGCLSHVGDAKRNPGLFRAREP
jgi:hypothetical protein